MQFVTLPTWSSIVASSSPYASGIFTSLITLAAALLGVILGALIVAAVARAVLSGVKQLPFVRSKGRGRRRR